MDLEGIASIAQIFSTLGVVVSLLYVSVQVRHNTRALMATTYNAVSANTVAILAPMYQHAEFSEFLTRVHAQPAAATPADRMRFHALLLAAFRHWDNLYYQFRTGTLEATLWESYNRTCQGWMANEAWRDWFRQNSTCFSPSLRELLREHLAIPAGPA